MEDDREEVVLRHVLCIGVCLNVCSQRGTVEQTAVEGGTVSSPFWL